MNKRGQVTIFVIIALILIVAISAYFIVRNKVQNSAGAEKVSLDNIQVQEVVQQCLDENLLGSVILLGFQGGWVFLPENYLATTPANMGYAYYLGKAEFPSILDMQTDIGNYINFALPYCFNKNNFTGYDIKTGNATAKTMISDDDVRVNVDFPITITKENITSKYSSFSSSVPIRLGEMHSYVSGIINNVIADPQYVEVSYLLTPRYNVSYVYDNQGTVVYTILDYNSSIYGEPYTFKLATKAT